MEADDTFYINRKQYITNQMKDIIEMSEGGM